MISFRSATDNCPKREFFDSERAVSIQSIGRRRISSACFSEDSNNTPQSRICSSNPRICYHWLADQSLLAIQSSEGFQRASDKHIWFNELQPFMENHGFAVCYDCKCVLLFWTMTASNHSTYRQETPNNVWSLQSDAFEKIQSVAWHLTKRRSSRRNYVAWDSRSCLQLLSTAFINTWTN